MQSRSLPVLALAVPVLFGLTTQTAQAGGGVAPLTTVRVASGLNRPIFATHAPGDATRLFIVEQRGVIKILDLETMTILPASFLDINSLVAGPVNIFDERGLLGLAFHPNYQANGFFYVNYTNNFSDTTVARYHVPPGTPNDADESSAELILFIDQPQTNHNGGWLGFSPIDGYLYIGTGDGGNFCDIGSGHVTGGNGQDITGNLLGKMLRIIPSTGGGGGYTIPPDNPFVGVKGDDEIWAYGLRNPWRSSFDRANGDLYIADVGQNVIEEINYQEASSTGGENYGWRCFEGDSCSSISGCRTDPCGCSDLGLVFPIDQYTHALGFSITGGYVYRGCRIPSAAGHYFYADYGSERIWSWRQVGGAIVDEVERTSELAPGGGLTIDFIASFGEDQLGEVYIVDRGSSIANGEVFKIIPETGIADFDCDGMVGIVDFLKLLANWGPCDVPLNCPWDLDGDGVVGIVDFLELLAQWGPV